MKPMKVILFSLLAFTSTPSFSLELDMERGITLHVLNEEKVSEDETPIFIEGENQLVLTFEGRLKKVAKPEHLATSPYVVRTSLKPSDVLTISLLSNRYDVIQEKQLHGEPIFDVKVNGVDSNATQQYRLEPESGTLMPYSDVKGLIVKQNRKDGLLFESGKFHHLKAELKSIDGDVKAAQYSNSEASLQLKIWFSKASNQEKQEFLEWVIRDMYAD